MSEPRNAAVTWVLEPTVFADDGGAFERAALAAGHHVVVWKDEWLESPSWPALDGAAVVFHGSLGNAHQVRKRFPWRPGAFCDTEAFSCSAWYPRASPWLLHRGWRVLPAETLVKDPAAVLAAMGSPPSVFIRPDSPLKPFSGRVVPAQGITLKALDHGYYYEDASIPVVVAPVRDVGAEWRFVVADRRVAAGCRYASDRKALAVEQPGTAAWAMATEVAANMEPPESVYVLDLCEAEGRLWLLELNPFSGADLYACDPANVVDAVARMALAHGPR